MLLRTRVWALLAITALLLVGFGCAATPEAPAEDTSWKFHTIVDTAFVQQHLSIPMAENVMLIDARPYKPKYIKGHIPTAINLPDAQFDKLVDKLPKDKNDLLIFYCGGYA